MTEGIAVPERYWVCRGLCSPGANASGHSDCGYVDALPHSRACGWRMHSHGADCHSNCPTCHGKPFHATPAPLNENPTLPEQLRRHQASMANLSDRTSWLLGTAADQIDTQPDLTDLRAKLAAVDEAEWTYSVGSIEEVMAYGALKVAVRRLFETEAYDD